ncbi:MAG TPA: hypothetical protein VHV82_13650 [Sporichthyaceae bacterium]|jgi:ferredoxin-NADP reductase|nr:hypothetical protein [Sporichthyaceae bacterium]
MRAAHHRHARTVPGTLVLISGQNGGLVATRRTRPWVVLIAAGIGITPMRARFEALPTDRDRLVLLYPAARQEDLVLRDELEELAERRGGTVHYLLGSRPADPRDGPLGPPTMMQAVARTGPFRGRARRSIHCERFSL